MSPKKKAEAMLVEGSMENETAVKRELSGKLLLTLL
jgi:hypothetical protein